MESGWRELRENLWVYGTTLDFGEEFAAGRSPDEFVSVVDQCFQLYGDKSIERFRLFFYPGHEHPSRVEKWIEFVTKKGVKELDLDFCKRYCSFIYYGEIEFPKTFVLPHCLFVCDSPTLLNLSYCEFNLPSNFNGFSTLETLSLKEVIITTEMLESIFLDCSLLENISLNSCSDHLEVIKCSKPVLQLKSLRIFHCYTTFEIDLIAPNLRSFHFNGDFFKFSLKNIDLLADAIISPCDLYCEFDFHRTKIVSALAHVKILTLCDEVLTEMFQLEDHEDFSITFLNLQELQLLMGAMLDEDTAVIYFLFQHCSCPCLEKLFIELPADPRNIPMEDDGETAVAAEEIAFHDLKVIKMNSFRGSKNEMLLVKFFLEKAIALESLVLVAPERGLDKDSPASESESLESPFKLVREQLLHLPKASPNAEIILFENSEEDYGLKPTHTKVQYAV